jgi:hypothetical protein
LQGILLQVEMPEIEAREACEPIALVGLPDAEVLTE